MGKVIMSGIVPQLTVPVAGTPVSDLAVGSTVKLKENGVLTDYLIVHKGLPSSMYDASCDGIWLLRKDIYENRQWHSVQVNDYGASTIKSYLNSTYLALFDSAVQNIIKQVKIPYCTIGGSNGVIQSGANGLECKLFLLASYEVGWTLDDNLYISVDGAKLDYFENGSGDSAKDKRKSSLNGEIVQWWLRSVSTYNTMFAWNVYPNGIIAGTYVTNSIGIRPALILESDARVLSTGEVIPNG